VKKIKSDPTLLAEVRRYGRFDANACLQCGSCTVVCDLADNSVSFPRRPLRFVLLGLKEMVRESLEPWICHDCGDCSTTCPREAEPAEAMKTIRRYLTAQYDWTGLASKINTSKIWYVGSLFFVGALVLLLALWYHLYIVELPLPDLATTALGLEHMFGTITYFTLVVVFLPLFFLISHAFRMYWLTMHGHSEIKIPFHLYLTEAKAYIFQSVTHQKFAECPQDNMRRMKHWLLAFGFVLKLFILVFFLTWFQTDGIYPVYHPQRWLGYLMTVFIVFGTVDILISRAKKQRAVHKSSDFGDLTFPILLLLTALSGIAAHIFRYSGLELTTHYAYALHLAIAVPMLVIEIPFGKLSHMIYRPLAIYFQAVKERALQRQLTPRLYIDMPQARDYANLTHNDQPSN
jgi:ferredoxin